mgnify:CR=1 FL=1
MAASSHDLSEPVLSPAGAPAVLELPELDATFNSVPYNGHGVVDILVVSLLTVVGACWLLIDTSPAQNMDDIFVIPNLIQCSLVTLIMIYIDCNCYAYA